MTETEQIPIPIPDITGLWDRLWKNNTSGTWAGYKETSEPPSTEAGIALYLRPVFEDISVALYDILGDQFYVNFHSSDEVSNWILVRNARPVGAVGVTTWGPGAMTDGQILGEAYDELMRLRSFTGLSQAYCILTCWNEWRFCCLEDTIDDAKKKEMPEKPQVDRVPALSNVMPKTLPPWPNGAINDIYVTPPTTAPSTSKATRSQQDTPSFDPDANGKGKSGVEASSPIIPCKLGVSKIIKLHGVVGKEDKILEGNSGENDRELLTAIASVLVKMAFSTESKLQTLLDPNRPVRLLEPEKYSWATLGNKTLDFSGLPDSDAEKFLLLLDLGFGTFGHCYLAVVENGTRACVLKLKVGYEVSDFEREAKHWRTIWDLGGVRTLRLNQTEALLMPDLKMCSGDYTTQATETREATRQAVVDMATKGYQHNEAYWRHVGLRHYRAPQKEGQKSLKAVLIDLDNVTEINKEDQTAVKEATRKMLNSLGFPADA